MAIDPVIEKAAFEVVERYIAAINAGDEDGVRDAFNFPHFRIGMGGHVVHYPDASANPLANFREKTLTDSWYRSKIDNLEVLATFPGKAHVGVHFRRLREDSSEIGAYYSLYIVTEVDGHWGIQGGSGTGT